MSVHAGLLLGHILFAAITIGATISYAVWIALAERHPAHLAFTIRAVRTSDRVVAIPAFALTLLTGLWLVAESGIAAGALWLTASVALYAAVLAVGFGVFGPVVRREIAALERGGANDPGYRRLRGQARALSYGTIAALVVILALMVVRPV